MHSTRRPVARLGTALTAAVLGLAMATAVAHADPTGTEPPPTSTTTEPPTSDSPSETPPVSDDPPPATASAEDVTVHAAFGQPSYATGEPMTITLTVTNNGTEPARFTVYFPHDAANDVVVTGTTTFAEYEWLDLDPGESVTNELTGIAANPSFDTATLHVRTNLSGDDGTDFTVPVTPRTVPVSGTVYYDEDHDGHVDAGEGIAGVTLTWVSGTYRPTVTTNADGAYSFDTSPGSYWVTAGPSDYVIAARTVAVPESGVDGVVLAAQPPLAKLRADLEFTKDTYRPEESPTVRVTLTNDDDRPLNGIVAYCRDGIPNITDAGWGDLAYHGKGVDLAPHSTRVFTFTEPMPAQSYDWGIVQVDCQFTYPDRANAEGNPADSDIARLPGQFVDVSGYFTSTPAGADLSGNQVTLTGPDGTCPIIGSATTGPDGKFTIKHVPAGPYLVYAVPAPGWDWKGSWNPPAFRYFVAGTNPELTWYLSRYSGPSAAPRPPSCPGAPGGGGDTPNPQGSAAPGLAYTGASLVVPGIAGLLALLAGAGAVVLTRRRKAT